MDKTVVLLTSSWCPRCPVAKQLWARLRDRFRFDLRQLDVDTPEGQQAATRWKISSVPAVIIDGELVDEVSDEARAMEILGLGETSSERITGMRPENDSHNRHANSAGNDRA